MSKKGDTHPSDGSNERKPDLSEIFDLNRHKAVREFATRFEELYKARAAVTEDLRELTAEAKEAMFSPVEVGAMRDIARWKHADTTNAAAAKLAALRRVSNAIKLDLFSWADQQKDA